MQTLLLTGKRLQRNRWNQIRYWIRVQTYQRAHLVKLIPEISEVEVVVAEVVAVVVIVVVVVTNTPSGSGSSEGCSSRILCNLALQKDFEINKITDLEMGVSNMAMSFFQHCFLGSWQGLWTSLLKLKQQNFDLILVEKKPEVSIHHSWALTSLDPS